jgi:hypothetical protein
MTKDRPIFIEILFYFWANFFMKTFKVSLLVPIVLSVVLSCSKETTSLNVAQTKALLLAGAKGASKSWKLQSSNYSVNGGTVQSVFYNDCLADNVYTFTNNAAQSYAASEGATKCSSTDANIVESGSWAFTDDGKMLVVDGSFNNSLASLLTSIHEPVNVVELTNTSFQISFTLSSPGNKVSYSIMFSSL